MSVLRVRVRVPSASHTVENNPARRLKRFVARQKMTAK